jgi:UDP-glucose 4-epimerase
MKRAILTGATGFIGANLARRLLKDGNEVHLLVRPGYNPWRIETIRSRTLLHEVDFCDSEDLLRVVRSIRPDWVFHLATHGAYSHQTNLRQIIQTNIVGTFNLVEACLQTGFEAFVNTGSSSEYGFKNHAPSETERLEPNSHYAVTKASATMFCSHAAKSKNLHLVTLRLYSVYGPYEESTRLIPTLILCGSKGELPPLVNPDVSRDYIYVDDVTEAYLSAIGIADQEPGAVYNVGTGIQTSLREVVDVAKEILGIKAEPQWGSMPNRSWDTSIWLADNRRIKEILNWKPRFSFKDGFRSLANWLSDRRSVPSHYDNRSSPP